MGVVLSCMTVYRVMQCIRFLFGLVIVEKTKKSNIIDNLQLQHQVKPLICNKYSIS